VPKRAFISLILKVSGNVNADIGVGTRIPMKKILTFNQEVKAFVSARCIRRCIRERLAEKLGPNSIDRLQLVGRGEEQLGDLGDPHKFVDDDLFGFLVPEEPPRKRAGAIKISPLISLRHTEIKPEFAARFPRDFLPEYEPGYPAPFEVEVAEWLGRLDVIVTDRIGKFSKEEVKEGSKLSVGDEERKRRLRSFLEILLYEGWQFPRAAESPSIPEFWYGVIALTSSFVPIFGYVDVDEKNVLDNTRLDKMKTAYADLLDRVFIINYKTDKLVTIEKTQRQEENLSEKIDKVIQSIVDYVFSG
jgi:CRISPR-associated protein Cas7/Cst2/DevR subtype I-B